MIDEKISDKINQIDENDKNISLDDKKVLKVGILGSKRDI